MKKIFTLENLLVPVSIIIAGVLIGAGCFFGLKTSGPALPPTPSEMLEEVRKVSRQDHIRGDYDAPIIIVEYSDTECPYCKGFHETLKKVMDEYGKDGKVAWVYRHFPLAGLHEKAFHESEALECAAELGGNDKFWQYTDRLYEVTTSNDGLDVAELPKIAQYVGLDVAKFNSCLSSGKYAEKINEDIKNAQETGAEGTPWSIIVTEDGEKYPIGGALPYEDVKQLIDQALAQ